MHIKKYFYKALFVFSFLFLFSYFFTPTIYADTVTVSGKVTDSSNNSISNATVSISDANTNVTIDSTTTNEEGDYNILLPQGVYNFYVTPPEGNNFSPILYSGRTINSTTSINFIFAPVGSVSLSGHIYNSNGAPIQNQTLALRTDTGTIANAETNDQGEYSMEVSAGNYYFDVVAFVNNSSLNAPQTYFLTFGTLNLNESKIIDATLPTKTVTVHVQDAQANAVIGARVKVQSESIYEGTISDYTVTASAGYGTNGNQPITDESGNVILYLFPTINGHYTLTITPPDGSPLGSKVFNNVSITEDETIPFTLPQSVTLSGHIYDSSGEPVQNQILYLRTDNDTIANAETNDQGEYSIQATPGDYYFDAAAFKNSLLSNVPQSYFLSIGTVTLDENKTLDITLPTKRVTVHVQDAGNNAVIGAKIRVLTNNVFEGTIGDYSVSGSSSYGVHDDPPVTNDSGDVVLWLFPTITNQHTIIIIPPDGSPLASKVFNNVSVTEDGTIPFVLPESVTLSGHIYDSSGTPLQSQILYLGTDTGTIADAETNEQGEYTMQVGAGDYNFSIAAFNNSSLLNAPQSYSLGFGTVTINESQTLDITLPTKTVTIHVQDSENNAIVGAQIKIESPNVFQGTIANYNVSGDSTYGTQGEQPLTDEYGNVILRLFPTTNNQYRLTVTPPDGSSYSIFQIDNFSVTDDETKVVSLQANSITPTPLPTYSLAGNVYLDNNQNGFQDAGENGYEGAVLTLDTNQTVSTDTNGNYTFSNLPAGTYIETLTLPNGYTATTSNPATVALNDNSTQNFGLFEVSTPTLVSSINTGGSTEGNYVADTNYAGGSVYTSSTAVDTSGVTNPAPEAVYQSVRYGNFSYTIPNLTPNGAYSVRLHFNELYWNSAGARVFNVSANGQQVLANYDIYQAAGGKNKAVVAQVPATADANGTVTLQFNTVTDNAMVNGIEVYDGQLPPVTPTATPTPPNPLTINAGGASVESYSADNGFTGGSVYTTATSVSTSGVTNPAPEAVYKSVRYGNFNYAMANLTPNTNYLVRLHFNELYWNNAGQRVFNVSINGNQVLSNYDIYQAAGGANTAVVEEFVKKADATGTITISFANVVDNAMVSGIELQDASALPTYSLSGTIYNDANDNGFQDSGEEGLSDVTVTIPTEGSATTDSNGTYTFSNLVAGVYTTQVAVPNGYIATTQNPVNVALTANTTQNFGVKQSNYAVNAGGNGAATFLTDQNYTGGSVYTTTNSVDTTGVTNPAPVAVYQSVRYGNFSYTIPNLTPNSTHTIRLHFNEFYWQTAGSRVFNISVNGTQVIENYDIYQAAGGANKAVVEDVQGTADANGTFIIQFTSVTDNAMVNGIELLN